LNGVDVEIEDQIVAIINAAEQLPEFFYTEDERAHSFVPLLDALDDALPMVRSDDGVERR